MLQTTYKHIKTVEKNGQEELLKERDNTTLQKSKTSLVLTYTWSLPNISKGVRKHWNVL